MEMKLPQTINNVTIVGTLKSKEFTTGTDESNRIFMKGKLTVQVKEEDGINELVVNVKQFMTTKSGTENKLYKALQTIQKEYISLDMVEAAKQQGNNTLVADEIRVNGEYEQFMFPDQEKGDIVEITRIKGTFINRNDKNEEHKALADIEGYIKNIVNKEDGTIDFDIYPSNWAGSLNKFTLSVTKPDLVSVFPSVYYEGATALIHSNIINKAIVESGGPVAFGTASKNIVTRYIRSIDVYGGQAPTQKLEPTLAEQKIEERRKEEMVMRDSLQQNKHGFPTGSTGQENPFASQNNNPFAGGMENPFVTA